MKTIGGPGRARPLPAKLAFRRMAGMVDRDRLIRELDATAGHAITWVQGPAGSGKSTLVGSYLERRSLAHLWYRADDGDADPASCFAGLALGTGVAELPTYTPEAGADLPAFARRFWRALFAQEAAPPVLVFDEFENAGGPTLQELLRVAAAELPPGRRVIVTSRGAAPPALAHLGAKGQLATIGWESLRLTADEASEMAERRAPGLGPATALHEACDGWVAGYVLLLEAMNRRGAAAGVPPGC